MKKEHTIFLLAGFVFGVLFGYGLFNMGDNVPQLNAQGMSGSGPATPSGPRAPAQVGGAGNAGGAPMMAELNALKQRLQDNPADIDATVRLANIYHEVAMWDQAITYYQMAVEAKPDVPNLITDLGVCLRNAGRFEEALQSFERAQEINPEHWQSLFNIAIVAGFDLQRWELALGALDSMESMNPQPPRLAELRKAITEARAAAGQS